MWRNEATTTGLLGSKKIKPATSKKPTSGAAGSGAAHAPK